MCSARDISARLQNFLILAQVVSLLVFGVFAYWGWESAVNLTEETSDSESGPGRAGLWSTVILLVTYVAVVYAIRLRRHPVAQ